MTQIVIEHVPVADLPSAWRAKLTDAADALVTVRIEQEVTAAAPAAEAFETADPAFGIWRDREDLADVEGHVRRLREPRFNRDGSRNKA